MRQQHYLTATLRDVPADAEAASHRLMLRAGLVRQLAAGVYSYLPLGLRVLRRLQSIVREEMDRIGAQEAFLPSIQPAELWKQSGRWDIYGAELMRLTDRHGREFALGPTHEEVITTLVRDEVRSYRQLPLTLYQIQTKFRDERRPRFGVLRSREFMMKDAYSFDMNEEQLDASYRAMYGAYTAIFTRSGLQFRAVEADSGAIGGTGTHEFMVLADIGEDTIAYCDSCEYAANIEKAEATAPSEEELDGNEDMKMTAVSTPNIRTIEQLTGFLKVESKQIIKTMAVAVDGQIVIALLRGDYELNELKLKHLFQGNMIEMLSEEQIAYELQSVPGFIGPVGLERYPIIADHSVSGMVNAVIGANRPDEHYANVRPGRDFAVKGYYDIRNVQHGDGCPRCGEGRLSFTKGIEVGHIFKLGTKYSEKLGATFLDENGKAKPMIMGCYGIGISRLLAAVIEQNHDDRGIVWPAQLAPFDVHLIPIQGADADQHRLAEQLYATLQQNGFEVLMDDRNERAGVKFNDADLIGLPYRVVIGKKAADGIVECKNRRTGETVEIPADRLIEYIRQCDGHFITTAY